jgi:acyl carrier protein
MPEPLTPEAIRSAVVAILAAQALRAPEDLAPGDRVADLGIDSLGMAEVIFALEERFDLAVPMGAERDPALDLGTVGGVVAAVQALLARTDPVA